MNGNNNCWKEEYQLNNWFQQALKLSSIESDELAENLSFSVKELSIDSTGMIII